MERRFRNKKITPDQCARIVTLRNDAKWSYRKIAKAVNCSISTVNYQLKKFEQLKSTKARAGRGKKHV